MNEMFAKFNNLFGAEGLAGLKEDVDKAGANTGNFEEVPHNDYEVKISKLALEEVTNEQSANYGMPKVSVWFTILAGDYKNQKIFMTQMVHKGFGIHKMNEFLESLQTGIPVQFENFNQYGELLKEIFNYLDTNQCEYQLAYTANPKNPNFSNYTIVKKF